MGVSSEKWFLFHSLPHKAPSSVLIFWLEIHFEFSLIWLGKHQAEANELNVAKVLSRRGTGGYLILFVTLEFKNFLKINIFGKFYKKKSLFSYFFLLHFVTISRLSLNICMDYLETLLVEMQRLEFLSEYPPVKRLCMPQQAVTVGREDCSIR